MSHTQAERYARALRIILAVRHPRRGDLERISRQVGYSRVHVSEVLAARRQPSERFLAQSCAALGCSREMLELLAGKGPSGEPLVDFLRGTWA